MFDQPSIRTVARMLVMSIAAALFVTALPGLSHADPRWGKNFIKAKGPNKKAELCQTILALYQGAYPISASGNDFVGHVETLEALQAALPEDASEQIQMDFALLLDAFEAMRDASAQTGLIAFNKIGNPELAGAEGRINAFIGGFCGISVGDPSYAVDPPAPPQTACPGWPSAGSPLTANTFPNLLDVSAANYFLNFFNHGAIAFPPGTPGFIDVPFGGSVEFQGEYPRARYFAFHPNDVATNNFSTLRDVDLVPDPGSKNPWLEETEEGEFNTFTAVFDFTQMPPPGGIGAPNTTYVGRLAKMGGTPDAGIGPIPVPNPLVFHLLRNYGSYEGALPPNFTGVDLPSITVYDAAGNEVQHFPACDPYPPGFTPPVDGTKFPSWPVADHRASSDSAGQVRRSWQFGAPVDILTNADVFYTITAFSKLRGNVLVLRAKKPTSSPPVANPRIDPTAQARLFTACIYNFWNGTGNDCVTEDNIVTDEDGFYTLVVSEPEDRPANATAENGFTWLNWGPFLDGTLSMRNLMVDDPFWEDMAVAIETGVVPPTLDPDYVPVAAHCHTGVFEESGLSGCFDWNDAQYGN